MESMSVPVIATEIYTQGRYHKQNMHNTRKETQM